MRILFDHQAFEMQRFGGVSHSYAELIAHLQSAGYDCRIGLKESDNVHLQKCGLAQGVRPLHYIHQRLFEGGKKFKGQRALIRGALKAMGHHNDALDINREYCIHLLKQQRFDIFEPTYFDPYFLPYLKGKPFVLTVHDMIPELLGIDKQQADWKKEVCPLASHIHVPSENTKKDLINILHIPPGKVSVIPHGAPNASTNRYSTPYTPPYLLYVGARWSYKNFEPFLKECAIAIAQCPDLQVVCTGIPFNNSEQQLLTNMNLTNHVIHHHATEQELQALYQNALAFVYPSAYEGFGLPILEAFVCGCPVMLNNASCFPEVGGEAAIYFDIKREGDLANHILDLLRAPTTERENIITQGYKRAGCFSWEHSAALLGEQYQKIITS